MLPTNSSYDKTSIKWIRCTYTKRKNLFTLHFEGYFRLHVCNIESTSGCFQFDCDVTRIMYLQRVNFIGEYEYKRRIYLVISVVCEYSTRFDRYDDKGNGTHIYRVASGL